MTDPQDVDAKAYQDAATLLYGEAWSSLAYGTFRRLSEYFFDGRLSAARPLRLEFLPYGRCFALTHGSAQWDIAAGTVRFDPRHLGTPQSFAEITLHEMGHVAVGEGRFPRGRGVSSHTTDGWIAFCRHVARILGRHDLVIERPRNRRMGGAPRLTVSAGALERRQLARFPYDVCPLPAEFWPAAAPWKRWQTETSN